MSANNNTASLKVEECEVFSLVVDGEETFWLCERRTKGVLPDNWRQVDVFWLYPAADPLPEELESSSFFDPTDCVFERLTGDQYSRVSRQAMLRFDVPARRVTVSSRVMFLVKAEEMRTLEASYRTFLKNEELALAAKEERLQLEKAEIKKEEETRPEENPSNHKKGRLRRHKSKHASAFAGKTRSTTEVSEWTNCYIIHRGGVPVLCPSFTGNSFGFRLHKAVNNDFAVFLLFLGNEAPIVGVEPTDVGVPVLETAELGGEETEVKRERRVLVLTRVVGSRKGAHGRTEEEINAVPKQKQTKRHKVDPEELQKVSGLRENIYTAEDSDDYGFPDSSDMDDDDDDDDDDENGKRRKTKRRKETRATVKTGSDSLSGPEKASRGRPRKDASGSVKREKNTDTTQSKSAKKESLTPLKTFGVNMYTDVTNALPPSTQIIQSFSFTPELGLSGSPSQSSLRTAVLPNGTCVTFTPETASRVSGANASSSSATNLDGDIRGLLAHIKLAQEQAHATTP